MRQSFLKQPVTAWMVFFGLYALIVVVIFGAANESFLPPIFRVFAVVGILAPFFVLAVLWIVLGVAL
jgi:hypothetical protein